MSTLVFFNQFKGFFLFVVGSNINSDWKIDCYDFEAEYTEEIAKLELQQGILYDRSLKKKFWFAYSINQIS